MKHDHIRKMAAGLAGAALAFYTTAAIAQDVEYPSAVKTFRQICLMPGTEPADRLTALKANGSWQEEPAVTVDIPKMAISRAIAKNYSFEDVQSARQWTGEIDGHKARIVLASFTGKPRYPHLCAMILDGPRNALPYGSDLRAAFKAFGIGGKSVDLVHYYEFAGKVGSDKHPVRGEVYSRSLAGSSKQTTHIYVAY